MLTWTIELYRPGREPETVGEVSELFDRELSLQKDCNDLRVDFASRPIAGDDRVEIELTLSAPEEPAQGFVALTCTGDEGEVWHYGGKAEGEELFRQSPHDPGFHGTRFAKQAAPMAAIRTGEVFHAAVSDHPGTCGNATTQRVAPSARRFVVASGDPGDQPGMQGNVAVEARYHTVTAEVPHRFRLIAFRSNADDLNRLRLDLFHHVASAWGDIESRFGALCFATNYLHLRRNETGYSRLWIVPGIDYSNKQYTRDAFWQALVMPAEIEQHIYDAFYPEG